MIIANSALRASFGIIISYLYLTPARATIVNVYSIFLQGLPGPIGAPGYPGRAGRRVSLLQEYKNIFFFRHYSSCVRGEGNGMESD